MSRFGGRPVPSAAPDATPLPLLQLLSQADFSGLRELLESGEATEEDATQWLHDNIEKYNIYAQVWRQTGSAFRGSWSSCHSGPLLD
jgi:hypothetical protein